MPPAPSDADVLHPRSRATEAPVLFLVDEAADLARNFLAIPGDPPEAGVALGGIVQELEIVLLRPLAAPPVISTCLMLGLQDDAHVLRSHLAHLPPAGNSRD